MTLALACLKPKRKNLWCIVGAADDFALWIGGSSAVEKALGVLPLLVSKSPPLFPPSWCPIGLVSALIIAGGEPMLNDFDRLPLFSLLDHYQNSCKSKTSRELPPYPTFGKFKEGHNIREISPSPEKKPSAM